MDGLTGPMYPMDILQSKQAKIVFSGFAPVAKGIMIHLECPRIGSKLGCIPEDSALWLSSERLLVPGLNIVHISRDTEAPSGAFHWQGRTSGIIEAIVRKCISDGETQQTYFEVDVIAERQISQSGEVTTRLPTW